MAYARALESERADALFQDDYARHLAGHIGEAMAHKLGHVADIVDGIAIRTVMLDWLILDMIIRLDVDLVLNIGSGLDTRPWRLPLPYSLVWTDVDHPGLLDHKSQALASERPHCQYRSIGGDILNAGQRQTMLEECAQFRRVLVVTEGLLLYLPPTQVQALAGDIHRQPACQWWLTDLLGARSLLHVREHRAPRMPWAEFHFAPADSSRFFGQLGWREAEFHSSWEEGRRLRRTAPLPFLGRLRLWLGTPTFREEFRRLAGIAVLAREHRPAP